MFDIKSFLNCSAVRTRRTKWNVVESMEQRCLLTTLGDPPVISCNYFNSEYAEGVVTNVETGNVITVTADIDNDGTVDETLETIFDSTEGIFRWSIEGLAARGDVVAGFDIAFLPVETAETGGADPEAGSSQSGTPVVVHIQASIPSPVLTWGSATESLAWGEFTDEAMNSTASYFAEIAVDSEENGFVAWQTEVDSGGGGFFADRLSAPESETGVLFIRLRKMENGLVAYSNVIRCEIMTPEEPGTGEGDFGDGGQSAGMGFSGEILGDIDSLFGHSGDDDLLGMLIPVG
ncbi:MAG: hypothetical protein KDA91_13390 [Planctomycetaceae bacterium]|nr:hypothetical protein [Planctomycetaceae bacterium]